MQKQQNRFGLHGHVAACVLPDDFKAEHSGTIISENKEADYAVITIKEPFIQPFERIPRYRLYERLYSCGCRNKGGCLFCFQ